MQKRLVAGSISAIAMTAAGSASALSISPTNDAGLLADQLFLDFAGLSITGTALSYGADGFNGAMQAGLYNNTTGTYGMPVQGIALSSGAVANYGAGPNTQEGFTGGSDNPATGPQNAILGGITGQSEHFDPIQLDIAFDAGPGIDGVTFFATFGSEEFPDFVGSSFIDGFGLLVNGTNVAGAVPAGGGATLPININHPDMTPLPGTELNGVLAPNGNPVLLFDVPVNPGAANTFSLILGDAGDSSLDTTVYISSFGATGGGGGGGGGTGGSEFDPILPSNPPDPATGEFIIEVPADDSGQTVWIDPPASTGFIYEIAGDLVEGVTAPSLATVADIDGYLVTVGGTTESLAAGGTLDFLTAFGGAVDSFTLTGIDPSLLLDPNDPLAFPLGFDFLNGTGASASVTPIVEFVGVGTAVPLPGALALQLGALAMAGGGLALRRRRRGG